MIYLPLLICAAALLAVLLVLCWPWLKRKETRERTTVALLAVLFLSLALYLHVGSPFTVEALDEQQQENARLNTAITALEAELQAAGDAADVTLYAKLGAAYIEAQRYVEASEALKQAVVLSEGQPELILMYGKAQMMAADGEITEGAKHAFEMAAALMPENPDPLFMLALERMQAGDSAGARERLKVLLPLLPEGIPLRRMVEQQLKEE